MTELMQSIDESYRAASALNSRGDYKIFYSHIHPFPILVLGLNPGGATDGANFVASDSFFENWEHDYPRFRNTVGYALAGPICQLLEEVLATKAVDALRQIPATNVIFRRSQNIDALSVSQMAAANEAKASLAQIVAAVSPRVILFISKTAYDLFVRIHCKKGTTTEDASSRVFTPNGVNSACIFLRGQGVVNTLSRSVDFLTIGHPSKYAGRSEWLSVTSALRSALEELGVSPIERTGALVPILPLPEYLQTT